MLIIAFFILLIHFVLGVVVIAKQRRVELRVAFVAVALSILIIEFGYIMILLTPEPESAFLWARVALVGHCFMVSSYVLLTSFFWGQYCEGLRHSSDSRRETRTTPSILLSPFASLLTSCSRGLSLLSKRLKYAVLVSYLLGVCFSILIFSNLFLKGIGDNTSRFELVYNQAGKILVAYLLCVTLFAIYNAEKIYRQATYSNQTHVRTSMLVLISSLSFHVLLNSLTLMYRYVRIDALTIASLTLVAANVLLARGIIKIEPGSSRIYVSREVISKSYTALLAGIFLLLLGLMGQIIQLIERNLNLFLAFFIAFVIIFVFIVMLVSRSIRQRFQMFIERHFYKEAYDYRREWERFSRRIFSIIETNILPSEILNVVSTAIQINQSGLISLMNRPVGSSGTASKPTVVAAINMEAEALSVCADKRLIDWLWRYGKPVKINDDDLTEEQFKSEGLVSTFKQLRHCNINVCVPIIAERQFLAILMLGPKGTGQKYSNEDLDLLETMAHQVSIAMLNANRREQLMMSKELEQFQRLSAFILHDVKNAVSMLSLVMENAADNLDKPEFQTDMLRTVDGAVKRLQRLMSKLSALPAKTDLKTQPTSLEQVLDNVIEKSGVLNLQNVHLVRELTPVPHVFVDPEEIEKVIFNLLLNAIEALKKASMNDRPADSSASSFNVSGEIKLKLSQEEVNVCLQISDTGCGMSQEFIRYRLFKPFQTTKNEGLGIGLYQCKTIVEAHGGTIDVESEEGMGSCFTIRFPR